MKATSIALTILLGLVAGIASAQIRVLNVTNLADGLYGLPAYGSLAAISCAGLSGIVGTIQATQYPLPYQLAGIERCAASSKRKEAGGVWQMRPWAR
jgi:hypothetical protein